MSKFLPSFPSMHWGEEKVPVVFQVDIEEIAFTRNDAFLPNSTYSFFPYKKKKNVVRTFKSYRSIHNLRAVVINERLEIVTNLYKNDNSKATQSYLKKEKKLVVEQTSIIDKFETLRRKMGYIVLPLHELVRGKNGAYCEQKLIDPDDYVEAVVKFRVRFKVGTFEANYRHSMIRLLSFRSSGFDASLGMSRDNDSDYGDLENEEEAKINSTGKKVDGLVAGDTKDEVETLGKDLSPLTEYGGSVLVEELVRAEKAAAQPAMDDSYIADDNMTNITGDHQDEPDHPLSPLYLRQMVPAKPVNYKDKGMVVDSISPSEVEDLI